MNASAERIRAALLEAARRAHDEAGLRGLCAEGRWEAALDALRSLELDPPGAARAETPLTFSNAREDATHREWLRHAYAFYLHDLSPFARDEYRLSPHGRWEPDHLPYWLSQPFCHPLVVLRHSVPVGFAFVGRKPFPFMSENVELRLSEFFVLRGHRRSGLGRAAARAVFARFPGLFEVTVLERNQPALDFWRSVLPASAASPVRESVKAGLVRFAFATAAG